MQTRSLPSFSPAANCCGRAFILLLGLLAASGASAALHTVSFSNGIDPLIVICDGDPGDLDPDLGELEIHFTLEDPIADDWVASGTILATTTDPAGATLVVTDTTIQNVTGEQVLGAQIIVHHDFPPVVTLTGAYTAHIDGSFDKIGGGMLGNLILNFNASMTGHNLGGENFAGGLVEAPVLFAWTGLPVHEDTIIKQTQHFIFYMDALDDTINLFDSATILPTGPAVPALGRAALLGLLFALGAALAILRLRTAPA